METTKMIGKHGGKPFCGDCCCPYPKGSGKRNKRILKRLNKRREGREWKKEYWPSW